MTRLLLIRHGSTDWNEAGRLQGHADVPLNAAGIAQAKAIAADLRGRKPAAIYSSDLARASLTARYIGKAFGLQVKEDPRLREMHLGIWEGLHVDEIKKVYPGELERRNSSPCTVCPIGGETARDVACRAASLVEDIIIRHAGQEVIVVSHGIVIRVIEQSLTGQSLDDVFSIIPGNGEIRELEAKVLARVRV